MGQLCFVLGKRSWVMLTFPGNTASVQPRCCRLLSLFLIVTGLVWSSVPQSRLVSAITHELSRCRLEKTWVSNWKRWCTLPDGIWWYCYRASYFRVLEQCSNSVCRIRGSDLVFKGCCVDHLSFVLLYSQEFPHSAGSSQLSGGQNASCAHCSLWGSEIAAGSRGM